MRTMKIIAICFALCLSIASCTKSETANNTTIVITVTPSIEEDKENLNNEGYNSIIESLGQNTIEQSIILSGSEQEYRVINSVSFLGFFYYSLQVYEDGTGLFTYIVNEGVGNEYDENFILLNSSIEVNDDEVAMLLQAIEENDFWNIPSIHPDERAGCDGTTVYIQGYKQNKMHLISMWMPGEQYGIKKIYNVFSEFADTIAENPLS